MYQYISDKCFVIIRIKMSKSRSKFHLTIKEKLTIIDIYEQHSIGAKTLYLYSPPFLTFPTLTLPICVNFAAFSAQNVFKFVFHNIISYALTLPVFFRFLGKVKKGGLYIEFHQSYPKILMHSDDLLVGH